MEIHINPQYDFLRPWIITIPQIFSSQGTIIYQGRNQIRTFILPNGMCINVKQYRQPALYNRLAYSYIRDPKAVRAYNNALYLQGVQIPTPTPIAYILCNKYLLKESYLITIQSPLTRNFYEFRYNSIDDNKDVITEFAKLTADIHKKNILHKDYSPGNILFDRDSTGKIHFSILDINRMQLNKEISLHCACKNFCRLWGNEDFFIYLAQEYAKARGWDEKKVKYWTIFYWKRFWKNRK